MIKYLIQMIIAHFFFVLHNQGGFAKVTGPLFSISASGKIADAMVYFSWKGLSVVREWKVPANPQTGAQGDTRVMLGGLGRACSPVNKLSQFATYARETTPSGQTWVSEIQRYMFATYFTDAAAFAAHDAEEGAHGAHLDFDVRALEVGLAHFNLAYKAMATQFTRTHMLYCMAKYGCDMYLNDNTKFNAAPYTKALATWVDADIVLLIADFPDI